MAEVYATALGRRRRSASTTWATSTSTRASPRRCTWPWTPWASTVRPPGRDRHRRPALRGRRGQRLPDPRHRHDGRHPAGRPRLGRPRDRRGHAPDQARRRRLQHRAGPGRPTRPDGPAGAPRCRPPARRHHRHGLGPGHRGHLLGDPRPGRLGRDRPRRGRPARRHPRLRPGRGRRPAGRDGGHRVGRDRGRPDHRRQAQHRPRHERFWPPIRLPGESNQEPERPVGRRRSSWRWRWWPARARRTTPTRPTRSRPGSRRRRSTIPKRSSGPRRPAATASR